MRDLQGPDTPQFHQGTPLSVVELLSARCRTCRVQCIPQEARWLVLRLLWAPPYRQWLHPCHHQVWCHHRLQQWTPLPFRQPWDPSLVQTVQQQRQQQIFK